MKKAKSIILCVILACGAIAGAAIGIMAYQVVSEAEDRLKGIFGIKKFVKRLPLKLIKK